MKYGLDAEELETYELLSLFLRIRKLNSEISGHRKSFYRLLKKYEAYDYRKYESEWARVLEAYRHLLRRWREQNGIDPNLPSKLDTPMWEKPSSEFLRGKWPLY